MAPALLNAFDRAVVRILAERELGWSDLSDLIGLEDTGSRGWTPLMAACRTRNTSLVQELLDAGANPNAVNATGTTPLMFAKTVAFASGDMSVMDLLIAAGADPNAQDKHGLTARDYTEQRSQMVADYLKTKENR